MPNVNSEKRIIYLKGLLNNFSQLLETEIHGLVIDAIDDFLMFLFEILEIVDKVTKDKYKVDWYVMNDENALNLFVIEIQVKSINQQQKLSDKFQELMDKRFDNDLEYRRRFELFSKFVEVRIIPKESNLYT